MVSTLSDMQSLVGKRFGSLTIESFAEKRRSIAYYECLCDCGSKLTASIYDLKRGHTQSCGCLQRARTAIAHLKHGQRHTRLWYCWQDMKARCFNPKNKRYSEYGGRGITVCAEWKDDFQAFFDWAIWNGYSDSLTLDRREVNGNYEPLNCRWATGMEQGENRQNTKLITIDGETHHQEEWARIKGLSSSLIIHRIKRGMTPEEAITTPLMRRYK